MFASGIALLRLLGPPRIRCPLTLLDDRQRVPNSSSRLERDVAAVLYEVKSPSKTHVLRQRRLLARQRRSRRHPC